ncbi:unnamed protein product [Onchocerca ochengi]|uniref:Uncharacterized protein n=1 Tax=Onchocerca ochengi TaxID=42157 RepID=A0A182E962_ONCOC|nr:unnamed protein product [Onchocerca ochengi]
MTTIKPLKPPYFDDITETNAIPSFDNIELALKGCFRTEFFEDLKLLTFGSEKSSPNYPRKEFIICEPFNISFTFQEILSKDDVSLIQVVATPCFFRRLQINP